MPAERRAALGITDGLVRISAGIEDIDDLKDDLDPGARRGLMALIDFLLHFDQHLLEFVAAYGPWVYAILFAIVFAETGRRHLAVSAGRLAAVRHRRALRDRRLSTPVAVALLVAAAFAGDAVNYSIGRCIGPRVFTADERQRRLRTGC